MVDGDARREEFARVALPLLDAVYTAARYLTRDRDEADELVQETFLRAYRSWHRFQVGTNCKAWLLTIMHNAFRNRYRDQQREQRTIEYDDGVAERDSPGGWQERGSSPEDLVLERVLDAEVEEALAALAPEFLSVLVLVDIQELSYEEAAEALDCPVGTVRSRLSRARRQLHRQLADYARRRGLT